MVHVILGASRAFTFLLLSGKGKGFQESKPTNMTAGMAGSAMAPYTHQLLGKFSGLSSSSVPPKTWLGKASSTCWEVTHYSCCPKQI